MLFCEEYKQTIIFMKYQGKKKKNIAKLDKCTFTWSQDILEYTVFPLIGNHHPSLCFFIPYPQKHLKSFNVHLKGKVSFYKVSCEHGRFLCEDRETGPITFHKYERSHGKMVFLWLYKPNLSADDTENQGCVLNYLNINRNGQNHITFFEKESKKEIKKFNKHICQAFKQQFYWKS